MQCFMAKKLRLMTTIPWMEDEKLRHDVYFIFILISKFVLNL